MKLSRLNLSIFAALALVCDVASLSAQTKSCNETSAMARLARAPSAESLQAEKKQAGNTYRARLIYAARAIELDSTDKHAATLLLDLIPKGLKDPGQVFWVDLVRLQQCKSGQVSLNDLKTLEHLQARLADDVSSAVLLVPAKMHEYIAYSFIAVLDPSSNYPEGMSRVCEADHFQFQASVEGLPASQRKQLERNILNPDSCRVLAIREQ
jgi:hypothetical protein